MCRSRTLLHLCLLFSPTFDICSNWGSFSNGGGTFGVFAQVQQIDGGKDITDREFFWFTAIRKKLSLEYICSGALVGPRHVITASHCVESFTSVMVEVGYLCQSPDNCGRENEIIDVRDVYRHGGGGDFALLVLDTPVMFPVKTAVPYLGRDILPGQRTLKKKLKMMLIGAGKDGSTESRISFRVKKLKVTYIKTKKCRKTIPNESLVTPNTICSMAQDGNSCAGDSGAAVVVKGKGPWKKYSIVMGVHNFGYRNCFGLPLENPIGHFRVSDATELLRLVVCGDTYPAEWCSLFDGGGGISEDPLSDPESLAPTEPPTREPSKVPTQSGNDDDTPTDIEPFSMSELHTLNAGVEEKSLAFLSSDRLLSAGCQSPSQDWTNLRIWNFASETLLPVPDAFSQPSENCVNSARPNPSGSWIASGGSRGITDIWGNLSADASEATLYHTFDRAGTYIRCFAWHPTREEILAVGTDRSWIEIYDVMSKAELHTLQGSHTDDVSSLAFHPQGIQMASGSFDSTIVLWTVDENNTFSPWKTLAVRYTLILSIAYSPDGNMLASAGTTRLSNPNMIRLWSTASGELVHEMEGHNEDVSSVAWSPNGRYLVSGSESGDIIVFDAVVGIAVQTLRAAHFDPISSVAWSPDGLHIASADSFGDIKIWEVDLS